MQPRTASNSASAPSCSLGLMLSYSSSCQPHSHSHSQSVSVSGLNKSCQITQHNDNKADDRSNNVFVVVVLHLSVAWSVIAISRFCLHTFLQQRHAHTHETNLLGSQKLRDIYNKHENHLILTPLAIKSHIHSQIHRTRRIPNPGHLPSSQRHTYVVYLYHINLLTCVSECV